MVWYEIAVYTVAGLGGLTGISSAILSFYKAKPEKATTEIENFKRLFDEAQEERKILKDNHEKYVSDTDKKIRGLEEKIMEMDRKNSRKLRAINSAYRCKLPEKMSDCPVLKTLDEQCMSSTDPNCKL